MKEDAKMRFHWVDFGPLRGRSLLSMRDEQGRAGKLKKGICWGRERIDG